MLSIDNKEKAWVKKYKPLHIDEIILPQAIKKDLLNIVKSKYVPNMTLASQTPGTGKTTTALALCNDCDVDVLFVNASDVGIDYFRTDVVRFASAGSIDGKKKVVILDELDRGDSLERQKILRPIIEQFSKNCSFIITANDIQNVIDPILSRCPPIFFTTYSSEADKVQSQKDVIKRSISILQNENIEIEDNKILAYIVKEHFPDIRQILGVLQKAGNSGKIDSSVLSNFNIVNQDELLIALHTKNFQKLSELSVGYALNYSDFITKLYDLLYTKCKNKEYIPIGIEIIAKSQRYYRSVANLEIEIKFVLIQFMVNIPF